MQSDNYSWTTTYATQWAEVLILMSDISTIVLLCIAMCGEAIYELLGKVIPFEETLLIQHVTTLDRTRSLRLNMCAICH